MYRCIVCGVYLMLSYWMIWKILIEEATNNSKVMKPLWYKENIYYYSAILKIRYVFI